ncbi:Serine/threonine-protein kinase TNNI3K [Phytophthora citrophthora]|uniref:Serine/threonine-protein kinase TNNI3K n=1 Tax=Phytophthora citrophthora TaxID=4793 RepID=A0AAD9G8V8_9STRA|nr:Serine/threonine-protein kinase TNNI3K [Phytophthora citrophthora]
MESPFHSRVGKVVRKISDKLDEYEAVVVDKYTAVGENLTQTRVRVKSRLDSQEKKLSDTFEHCEASITNRYTSIGEHWSHTQTRLKDKLSSQERRISVKAAHLLSKPGMPKMLAPLRDKLNGDHLAIEPAVGSVGSQSSQGRVNSSKNSFDSKESLDSQWSDVTPGSETSSLSESSLTEFKTDDPVLIKARIPRGKVEVHEFISRGAFGKVYKGTYSGQLVAVKTMSDVETFVQEIKMAQSMSHPNVVQFIGVAWNYREDFCCVMEYMGGGDLRGLLDKYEEENRKTGFNSGKLTIALHVAHALAYLHSRDVPVLHRDLKSKNILLNEALGAKLTDFGVSRERVDRAMTADVGTSLWMAPEVMIGNAYDEKADIFSFGVVLSELSTHTLPYAHAKRPGSNEQLSPLVILHRVATGTLSVEFSKSDPQTMVRLGLACVSMDPNKRPTAAEAMRVLHAILMQEVAD